VRRENGKGAPRRAIARVLFLDHTPVVGGAELVLATHVRALDRARFHPIVACTDTVPMLVELYRSAGAEVHLLPMPRLRRRSPVVIGALLLAATRLRRLVRRLDVDLVVANTSRAAYIASVALVRTRVPLIWWVRDFLFGRHVFRLLARTSRRIVCVSDAIRRFYGGAGDPRYSVIYVGSSLDLDLPGIGSEQVEAERARWGFVATDVVVGFMGRLVEEKGPRDVIEAVAALHLRQPRLRLLVVGSGRGQEGDVEEELRKLVADRGWSFVVFAGFQRAEALYYRLFDVFVLGTRSGEPYATSVVQAMMAGTPVVATATGGTPELVRDRETGLLVPPRKPARIAEAIETLIDDPVLRRQIADRARRHVSVHNREAVTTRQAERIYDEVLETDVV
jgi:glycosyltransferase involved in cell wall biosynthesis